MEAATKPKLAPIVPPYSLVLTEKQIRQKAKEFWLSFEGWSPCRECAEHNTWRNAGVKGIQTYHMHSVPLIQEMMKLAEDFIRCRYDGPVDIRIYNRGNRLVRAIHASDKL